MTHLNGGNMLFMIIINSIFCELKLLNLFYIYIIHLIKMYI